MCINLWASTLEMEGITPYFGEVLNMGWNRRKWWKVCGWEEEIALVQCHVDHQQCWVKWCKRAKWDCLQRIKTGDEENSIFNYVSSEAHVHCLKTDFEILSVFELEQENRFSLVLHLTCIQSRFGWVPHLNC